MIAAASPAAARLAALGVDLSPGCLWQINVDDTADRIGPAPWPHERDRQARVGGYLEHVPVEFAGVVGIMFANEEGRPMDLPANDIASLIHCETYLPRIRPATPAALHVMRRELTVRGNVLLWIGPPPADQVDGGDA